jgi:hypothetical protein
MLNRLFGFSTVKDTRVARAGKTAALLSGEVREDLTSLRQSMQVALDRLSEALEHTPKSHRKHPHLKARETTLVKNIQELHNVCDSPTYRAGSFKEFIAKCNRLLTTILNEEPHIEADHHEAPPAAHAGPGREKTADSYRSIPLEVAQTLKDAEIFSRHLSDVRDHIEDLRFAAHFAQKGMTTEARQQMMQDLRDRMKAGTPKGEDFAEQQWLARADWIGHAAEQLKQEKKTVADLFQEHVASPGDAAARPDHLAREFAGFWNKGSHARIGSDEAKAELEKGLEHIAERIRGLHGHLKNEHTLDGAAKILDAQADTLENEIRAENAGFGLAICRYVARRMQKWNTAILTAHDNVENAAHHHKGNGWHHHK